VGLIAVIVIAAILLPMAKAKDSKQRIANSEQETIENPEFKGTLSNGVTVELVGLGTAPWETEQQWWRANGAEIDTPDYEVKCSLQWPKDDPNRLQFVCGALCKFSNYTSKDISVPDVSISNKRLLASGWTSFVANDGSLMTYIVSNPYEGVVPNRADISLAVGTGPFKIAKTPSKKLNEEQHEIYALEGGLVVIRHPLRSSSMGTLAVDLKCPKKDYEFRVLAKLKNGENEQWHGGSIGKEVKFFQATPKRQNTKVEDIKELIIEYRPYQWVTFKNVSVKPNFKTDVEVEGQELSFGPVVECVVYDKADAGDYLVDFDRLKLLSLPADFDWNSEKALEWVEENGVDAGGATQPEIRGLICYDMIVFPRNNDYWDRANAESVAKEGAWNLSKPGSPVYMMAKGKLPVTYQFKTREGGVGLLQIIGFAEKPNGVKIRYKMVNKPAGRVEREEDWGEAIEGLRCRLRPFESAWTLEQVPTLMLDLRNRGETEFSFVRVVEAHCEIEVDGQWYGWAEPIAISAPVWNLKPGGELYDAIEIKLTDSWALPKEGEQLKHRPGVSEFWGGHLKLTPSKHTVRVRFRPQEWMEGYLEGDNDLSLVSNLVGIEILPEKPVVPVEGKNNAIFESYFPDDAKAGKKLDEWWKNKDSTYLDDDSFFALFRKGLRMCTIKYKGNFPMQYIGGKYIWHKEPDAPRAIDIVYHASFSPEYKYYAVYSGLSVANPKSERVLKRLIDLAMEPYQLGRILWGVKQSKQEDEFMALLEPHLQASDLEKRERAEIVAKALRGEIDAGKWEQEWNQKQQTERTIREFSDDLSRIKKTFLNGTSEERLEAIKFINRNVVSLTHDESFIQALDNCAKDENPYVRAGAASILGCNYIWGKSAQPEKAIEILLWLSQDENRQVRYNTVYFGLSVVSDKSKVIVKRLVDMALVLCL